MTRQHASLQESLAWTVIWFILALACAVIVHFMYDENWSVIPEVNVESLTGMKAVSQFMTGYLVEKSIVIDTVFVFAMIFANLQLSLQAQYRLLFWGVIGAVGFRLVFLPLGLHYVPEHAWLLTVLAVLLLYSAIKTMVIRHDNIAPDRKMLLRLATWLFPLSYVSEGDRFLQRLDGKLYSTPMLFALLMLTSANILFALNTVPAIYAFTEDTFIIILSNVLAVLGMRSLYFVLAAIMERFRYFQMSLVFILAYTGISLLLKEDYPVPVMVSFALVVGLMFLGIIACVSSSARDTAALISPIIDEFEELVLITYRQARRVVILTVGSTIVVLG
ncbi:MAG: hypothetical protein EP315_03360, partial [Gammaproteobacteria bacterium]